MSQLTGIASRSVNPFLPSTEFIPDGEPRVFGDRVYLYGSHDIGGGTKGVCAGDYVCYSAALGDLSSWRFDGVIYPRTNDPYVADRVARGKDGINAHLFAPDVIEVNGRYLLYYGVGLSSSGIAMAAADSPTGPFHYAGRVRYPNDAGLLGGGRSPVRGGRLRLAEYPYDPALLHHRGRLFLYFGLLNCSVIELDPSDGLTMVADPQTGGYITPVFRASPLDALRAHWSGRRRRTAFVNGPSIREMDGRFFLSYWATGGQQFSGMYHAVADSPTGPFTPIGPLVSLGNAWKNQRPGATDRRGNTHGGMFVANGTWYQIYHRHTSDGRQACATPLRRRPEGGFEHAEYTSLGFDPAPLDAFQTWPAYIACHLVGTGRRRPAIVLREHPCGEPDPVSGATSLQVVSDTRRGSTVGFKYLDFGDGDSALSLSLNLSARTTGRIEAHLDDPAETPVGTVTIDRAAVGRGWIDLNAQLRPVSGVHAVYLSFHPDHGLLADLATFTIERRTP